METPAGAEAVAVLVFHGTTGQAQSAIDAANSQLPEFQRVRRWRLWPQLDLPRTAIGKVQRRKVTEWIAAQGTDAPTTAAGVDVLSELIAAITRTQPAKIEDEARLDLYLDSLARVQLQTELEQRLGVSIGDEEFERIATLGQLRARLGFAPTQSEDFNGSAPKASGIAMEAHGQVRAFPDEPTQFSYPRWAWWPWVQALRVLFQECVMRPLVWLLAAPTVRRSGELQRPEQAVLLIANHVTIYDAPLVLYALPTAMRRRVAIAMAGEMLEDWRHARKQGNWLMNCLAPIQYGLVTVLFNVFPLPRGAGFRRSFAHAGEAMDHGYHVLVFPEGRRSDDGALQPFRAGIGLLASESKARIVPVALKGLGELKQGTRRWFRSGGIEIRIGEAVEPDMRSSPEQLAESLHDAVSALLKF
jgi:long-chain acyl-CoA synthetase